MKKVIIETIDLGSSVLRILSYFYISAPSRFENAARLVTYKYFAYWPISEDFEAKNVYLSYGIMKKIIKRVDA